MLSEKAVKEAKQIVYAWWDGEQGDEAMIIQQIADALDATWNSAVEAAAKVADEHAYQAAQADPTKWPKDLTAGVAIRSLSRAPQKKREGERA